MRFLMFTPIPQQCVHDVHLRVRRAAVASRCLDFLHDHARGIEAEATAPIFGRNARGEKARFGQRVDKLRWIFALRIFCAPILAWKILTQGAHGAADFGQLFGFVLHLCKGSLCLGPPLA